MVVRIVATALFLISIGGGDLAYSQYLGVDRDGNLECDPGWEMTINPSLSGETNGTFDLFFSDMPNPLGSMACTFCFHDSSAVTIDSFVYHTPDGWSDTPIRADASQYSPWIRDANRKAKCYLVQSTDFDFMHPWDSPASIGTAYFSAARDKPIHIILDPIWSAYFTISYSTGSFCPRNVEESDSCRCPTPAPTRYDWGEGRSLIR